MRAGVCSIISCCSRIRSSPSDTEGISRCDWYRSKKGIEAVLGEVERCGGQFYDIIKDLEV